MSLFSPRNRVSSRNSSIKTSSQPTIPYYDDYGLGSDATDPLITELVNDGKLKVSSTIRIEPYKHRFLEHDKLTTQHIIGNSISMPHSDWEFTFDIYFPWRRPIHHQQSMQHHQYQHRRSQSVSHTNSRYKNNKYKKHEKVYVYTTFRASYNELQKIDNTIISRMSMGYKYFAYSDERYPSILKCTKSESIKNKRGETVQNEMKKEEEFIIKPILPIRRTGIFGGIKSATPWDLNKFAYYLHIILSSPSLCSTSFVFDELGFDEDLCILLRSLASNKLNAWNTIANQPCIRDPSRLLYKIGDEYQFHTVYIVRRPLNDQSLSLFNFNHWAIKMEGKKQLMTTEFFAYNEDHGIVKTQILPNTSINRRVFWFWWQRDPHDNKQKKQYFTERWVTMEIIYVGSIQIECIGKLICKWLGIHSNAQYSVTNNNCQHYVRDLSTILDMKIARKLNGFMDHRVVAAAIPAAALADGMSEEARTNEIYDELRKTVQEYKIKQDEKKNIKEEKDENQHFLANWNKCAADLGLDLNHDDNDENDESDNDLQQFYDQFGNVNHSNNSNITTTTTATISSSNNGQNIMEEEEEEEEEENNNNNNMLKLRMNMNHHQDSK